MATSRALVSFDKCELAVEALTLASSESSVAVSALPLMSAVSIRARAGSPINRATPARSSMSFPFVRHDASALDVVDDQNQIVIVIAVLHFDVHAGVGHPARDLAELSRLILTQLLHEHVVLADDVDTGAIERRACGARIVEKKVRDSAEHTAAFDADAGVAEDFAHLGESTGAIVECDREILHARTSAS